MPPRILLIVALAAACNEGVPPSPPPTKGSAIPAAAPLDAAVAAVAAVADAAPAVDAMQYALFDHLPFRIAKVTSPPPKVSPPDDLVTKPTLAVKAITDPVAMTLAIPAWCQHSIKKHGVIAFHASPDGSSIAATTSEVALVDAAHHPEIGIDFTGLHGTQPDEGGELNTTAFNLVDAVRDGDFVVAVADDPMIDGSLMFLIAVDARTGAVLWQTSPGSVQARVGIAGGHVIASAGRTLRALRVDTGRADASATAPHETYLLDSGSDGVTRGTGDGGDRIEVTLR